MTHAEASMKTKQAMADSLKRYMEVKSLSKITISAICEDCGINRKTFYYHFKDIYDLVEWACVEDGKRALQGKAGQKRRKEDPGDAEGEPADPDPPDETSHGNHEKEQGKGGQEGIEQGHDASPDGGRCRGRIFRCIMQILSIGLST